MSEQPPPSREETLVVLNEVLAGTLTREAAAVWAVRRHNQEHDDPEVEEALDVLCLIDATHGKGLAYLFDFSEVTISRDHLAERG